MSKLFNNATGGSNNNTNNTSTQLDNYEAETVEDIPEQFDLSRYKKISKMHQQNQQQQQQQQQQQSQLRSQQQPQMLSNSNFGYAAPLFYNNGMYPAQGKVMGHPIMSSSLFGSQYGPSLSFMPQQQQHQQQQQPPQVFSMSAPFVSAPQQYAVDLQQNQFRTNGLPPQAPQHMLHQGSFVPHQHAQQQTPPGQSASKSIAQHHSQHHNHHHHHHHHHGHHQMQQQPQQQMHQSSREQYHTQQEPASSQGYYKDSQGYSSGSKKKIIYSSGLL
jgi:hypothetical protein